MSGTTPNYKFPFPSGTDKLTGGATAVADLANKIDASLSEVVKVTYTLGTGVDPLTYYSASIVSQRLLVVTGYILTSANLTGGSTNIVLVHMDLASKGYKLTGDPVEVLMFDSASAEIPRRSQLNANYPTAFPEDLVLPAQCTMTKSKYYCFSATGILVRA